MALQSIGLQGVFDLRNFTQGVKSYEAGLARAGAATDETAGRMGRAGALIRGAGIVLGATVAAAATAMVGLGAAGLKLAADTAPIEGIMQGFAVSAARAGLSYDEFLGRLRTASRGLVSDLDLMKQANIALTGAGEDLAREFGEKLPVLLQIAQASARKTGQSTTFMFESLVLGIKRASPMLIDNTGLQLKLGEANEQMAREVGKSVDALSAQERQIAILRATVAAGEPLLDELAQATLTNAERMAELQIAVQNLKNEVGYGLQPSLESVITPLSALASKWLPELADAFGLSSGAVMRAAGLILSELAALPVQAAGYGQSLGIQFAEGIASAIPYILGVIRAISAIFTQWFAPHSPPKIAPEIDEWGRETVEEFFAAFPTADMRAVTSLARSIKSTLLSAIAGGRVSEAAASAMLDPLRAALVGAASDMAAFGQVSQATMLAVQRAAGPLGAEVAGLAEQFLAGETTDAARAAEEAAAAQRRYEMAVANTQGQIAIVERELAGLTEGTADYYDKLTELRRLQEQLAQEQEQVAEAQFQYALAQADTAGQIELWRRKLSQVTQGTAEYYRIQTTLYNLELQRQRELEELERAQEGLGGATGDSAADAKRAAAEAERLADAEFAYKLATADAAGKVALLEEKLASLEPNTVEWYQTATQLAAAQEALAKGAGAAGDAAEAAAGQWDALIDGLEIPELPDFAKKLQEIFDPERIDIDAEAIKDKILGALRPAFEESGGSLASFLWNSLRQGIATLLFGGKTVPIVDVEIQQVVGEQFIPADATWADIAAELHRRIAQAMTDAIVSMGADEGLATTIGNQWEKLLLLSLVLRSSVIQTALGHAFGVLLGGALKAGIAALVIRPSLWALGLGAKLVKSIGIGLAGLAARGTPLWTKAYLAGQELALDVGVALEAGYGSVTIGAGMVGLTAATLIPVLFPEETASTVDALYLEAKKRIADPIRRFWADLPGLISGKEAGFDPETQQFLPVEWEDVLDTSGLATASKTIGSALGGIEADWAGFKGWWRDNVSTPVSTWATVDVPRWFGTDVPNWFGAGYTSLTGTWHTFEAWWWEHVTTPLRTWATVDVPAWFGKTITTPAAEGYAALTGAWADLKAWWAENVSDPIARWVLTDMPRWFQMDLPNAITGALTAVQQAASDVADALMQPFEDAYDTIRDILTRIGLIEPPVVPADGGGRGGSGGAALGRAYHSGGLIWVGERGPELVDLPMGAAIMSATRSGSLIRSLPNAFSEALARQSQVVPTASLVLQPAHAGVGGSTTATVNLGPVTINGALDLAAFDARVRNIVRGELGRR